MAVGLQNFANIEPADSDYPNGRIKDHQDGSPGTPVNQTTNGDLQEFFAKLMRLASLTPTGYPDNEYSGHQYIDALLSAARLAVGWDIPWTQERITSITGAVLDPGSKGGCKYKIIGKMCTLIFTVNLDQITAGSSFGFPLPSGVVARTNPSSLYNPDNWSTAILYIDDNTYRYVGVNASVNTLNVHAVLNGFGTPFAATVQNSSLVGQITFEIV